MGSVARPIIAALAIAWISSACPAGTHTSSLGYTIDYPAGWHSVDPQTLKREDKEAFNDLASKLARLTTDARFMPTLDEDGTERIDVVVAKERTEINESGRDEAVQGVREEMKNLRATIISIDSEVITIGRYKAISIHIETRWPDLDSSIKQWQVILSAGGKTFCIILTALEDDYPRLEPLFRRSLETLTLKPDAIDSFMDMPSWVQLSIVSGVGGIVVLAVFMILRIRKRRRAQMQPQYVQTWPPLQEQTHIPTATIMDRQPPRQPPPLP